MYGYIIQTGLVRISSLSRRPHTIGSVASEGSLANPTGWRGGRCGVGGGEGVMWVHISHFQKNSSMSGEKKLLRDWPAVRILPRTTEWELAVTRSTARGGKGRETDRFHSNEKGNNVEKHTVIRKDHCVHQNTEATKESNRKFQWKRLREGHWTSSASTPYESVHCEAHNTQVEFPVNQSSQLPSTTSRHRASLAQDRRHVTSCFTQPPLLYRVSPVRDEDRDIDSELSHRLL